MPNNTGLRNRTLTDIRAVLRVHHPQFSQKKKTKEPKNRFQYIPMVLTFLKKKLKSNNHL